MSRRKDKMEHKKRPVAAVCSTLGTALLIIIILVTIPFTVPRVFGFDIYTVITGSMEPKIPVGSLVYVKGIAPEEVEEKDVIAFYGGRDSSVIITHRVVANSEIMGEFITKGDANKTKDMNPVPYSDYIGKVELSIPVIGGIAQTLASTPGRIAAGSLFALSVVLQILGEVLDKRAEKE